MEKNIPEDTYFMCIIKYKIIRFQTTFFQVSVRLKLFKCCGSKFRLFSNDEHIVRSLPESVCFMYLLSAWLHLH